MDKDTIAAVATAPGKGGIGIIRLSGDKASAIAQHITGLSMLEPRHAHYASFYDQHGEKLDSGIALFFPGPNSFTGEDVIELQGHGGRVILDLLLTEAIAHGARIARPGEFSERAFLNNKIDLVQAEAIADIIESSSQSAARSAVRSLSGEFSEKINQLTHDLTQLRVYVEAAIDFPDEEVDFISDSTLVHSLDAILKSIDAIYQQARQGQLIRDGLSVVIIGKPNAGKSSLLNLLAGDDLAIVNQQAGTTRDILREDIHIDGLPLRIIDTAGLRESPDEIEQEGIKRAKREIEKADTLLYMRDISENGNKENLSTLDAIKIELHSLGINTVDQTPCIVVNNKIDLHAIEAQQIQHNAYREIFLSAKTGSGLDFLKQNLKDICGYQNTEGNFVARRRHIDALSQTQQAVQAGRQQLLEFKAGELLAEELRQAQNHLGQITGTVTSDDLLGEIFSSFCIGK